MAHDPRPGISHAEPPGGIPERVIAPLAPDHPTAMSGESWRIVLRRTLHGFTANRLTDWAAALTYYGVLSIFPALLALVSVVGLLGPSASQALIDNIQSAAPGPAKTIVTSAITGLQNSTGAAGVLFVVGIAGAIWSASGYVAAFMRATNTIYGIDEGRPLWLTLPLRVAVTVVLLVTLAASAVAVVFTGGLAQQVGDLLGVGDTALTVFGIVKWPLLVLLVGFMVALLYWATPNVKQPGFRWITPGSALAVVLWIVVSALFALYVANFASYNKTYGSLGGVIAFLVWLWISNIAILLGAELNAELQRGRRIAAGQPAEQQPAVELRDTRALPGHDASG